MTEHQQKIESYMDEHAAQAISFLQKLVQQPSVQGNEKAVQEIVIQKLKDLGLEIDVWVPSHQDLSVSPYFIPSRNTYEGSPNVVGVLRRQGGANQSS